MATYLFDNSKNLVDVDSSGDKYGFDSVKNRLLFSYQEGVYGIDEHKNMIEVASPVIVPTILSDGSVLFYDRGEQYGDYVIINNNIIRISNGTDDGSANSIYWRYLICDTVNLSERRPWGASGTSEGIASNLNEHVGYGLLNTETMLSKYKNDTIYLWNLIQAKRDTTGGKQWFLPSLDELNIVYQNKDIIIQTGGNEIPTDRAYWSSSEDTTTLAWGQFLSDGDTFSLAKTTSAYCRLIRRV